MEILWWIVIGAFWYAATVLVVRVFLALIGAQPLFGDHFED